ncbi:MAG: lysophospholipid acyltransferase family protein [Pseudomonadota bacterium]
MKMFFRSLKRRIGSRMVIGLAHWAGRGGPQRIKKTGRRLGLLHYYLVWPFNGKLRNDIAVALDLTPAEARSVLRRGWVLNDWAAFEIIAQANPELDVAALIEPVTVESVDKLKSLRDQKKGAVLLSMHMGNTLLGAARLVRDGYALRAVFREPHRLPKGYFEQCMDRIGLRPMGMDRANPARVAMQMLRTLKKGEMVYVLMDQGTKKDGVEVDFLGKTVQMPTGIARLAEQTGVDVFPVNLIDDEPNLRFRIEDPIAMGDDLEENVRNLSRAMENHIREYPHLWGWHHRRWKRYHLKDSKRNS